MSEFLHMDGYAPFVWGSFTFTLGTLLLNVLWARRSLNAARAAALRRLATESRPL